MSKKGIGIVAGVLALILVLGGTAYGYYHSKIELLDYSDGTQADGTLIASDDEDMVHEQQSMEKAVTGLEEKDVVFAEGDIMSSEQVFNILLIGTDERTKGFSDAARGDTCMLLSLDKRDGTIRLVSFERGMGMPILDGPYKGQYDWLTHTFRYGGASLMMQEIRENFHIDVNYYARANISTFMEGVEAIGGVSIELTQEEADYINHPEGTYAAGHIREMHVEDLVQEVHAGENYLNGATAMLYARCRWIDSDWGRVQRQRKMLTSALTQAKNLSFAEIDELLDRVLPLIQTNLTESEITELITAMLPKIGKLTMEQTTIPQKETYGSMTGMGGRSMYAVDFAANTAYLQEMLYG